MTQRVRDISLAFRDVLGPAEILEIARRENELDTDKIDLIVRSVLQSSKQAKLTMSENEELLSKLSAAFSNFDKKEYTLEKRLGSGTYGEVSSYVHKETPTKKIAVKKFTSESDGLTQDVVREFGSYSLLSSARPTLYDDIVLGIRISETELSLALKLANGTLKDYGELFEHDDERIKEFPVVMDKCLNVLGQVHACNIIHADVKNENILVWWSLDKKIETLILSDFGISSSRPGTYVYTPPYRAPELRNEAGERFSATKSTDIWAMGITFVHYLFEEPFDDNYDEVIRLGKIPVIKRAIANILKSVTKILEPMPTRRDYLLSMLNLDPDERPKLREPILTFIKRDWSINLESDISVKMYRILFEWMWEVGERFNLKVDTIIQGIDILCRFGNLVFIDRKDLQGYGIMSMLVASKWGEAHPFEVRDAKYITDSGFTIDQLKEYEITLLKTLNGIVYIPGLEKLIDAIKILNSAPGNRVEKLLKEEFVTSPNEFLEIVKSR